MSIVARIRSRAVRTMPEGIARRRPSDAVRVVVAVVLLGALALHAEHPSTFEHSVTRVFAALPDDANSLVLIIYDLMALWAIGLLVVVILLIRRWRLARDLLVAGGAAWLLGRLAGFSVRDTDLWQSLRVTFDLTDAPRFPLVRVGIAVAVVTAAAPRSAPASLPRGGRAQGWCSRCGRRRSRDRIGDHHARPRGSAHDICPQRDAARGLALDFEHVRPLLSQIAIRGLGLDEIETEDILIFSAGHHTTPG